MELRWIVGMVFVLMLCPSVSQHFHIHDRADYNEPWILKHNQLKEEPPGCQNVQPTTRDIVRRFYAIVPYLDKEHANAAFLHKYRSSVYGMSEGDDLLDREAAYYTTIITPIIFLQQYKDAWCLLERFHRALRLYHSAHPTEKRLALKILQNVRGINKKINGLLSEISGTAPETGYYTTTEANDEEPHDMNNKDINYLKELIKNLG